MGQYITLGDFNKNYLFIIFEILALILKDTIYGYNYNESFITPISDGAKEILFEFNLIKHIYCYLITIIFSGILYRYRTNKLELDLSQIMPLKITITSSTTEYESDITSDNSVIIVKNQKINDYSKTFLFFIIFLWIIEEHLIEIFSILKDLDFWMIELIILSYFNWKMFKMQTYLHHKLIMILNLLPTITKIFSIILSFLDKYNKDGNYYEYNYPEGYEGKKLKNLYVRFAYLVPVGILIYLILITLRAYVNSNLKVFMDKKNIEAFKLLFIYGLFGTIISIFACLITTFVNCGYNNTEKDIYDYICKIQYKDKKYFDSFIAYYYSFEGNYKMLKILSEIIKNIFATIFFFAHKYYSIKIIELFTPIHLIFSFPVYYFIQKIILIITTAITEHSFFGKNHINLIEHKFIVDTFGDILSIIGFLVYLEIIELNFCGLEYNLRKNIMKRAMEN